MIPQEVHEPGRVPYHTHTESVGTLLGFPGSQTMRNTSLLFISHSVYGIFVIAAKGTKTVTEEPTVCWVTRVGGDLVTNPPP